MPASPRKPIQPAARPAAVLQGCTGGPICVSQPAPLDRPHFRPQAARPCCCGCRQRVLPPHLRGCSGHLNGAHLRSAGPAASGNADIMQTCLFTPRSGAILCVLSFPNAYQLAVTTCCECCRPNLACRPWIASVLAFSRDAQVPPHDSMGLRCCAVHCR